MRDKKTKGANEITKGTKVLTIVAIETATSFEIQNEGG
jgi:hypothetical protein